MQEIRDTGLIPELGISPGGGRGNPLQCSCLESSMDRGAWRATGLRATKRWIRLSDFTSTFFHLVFSRFTNVVAYTRASFVLLLCNILLCTYISFYLSIQQLLDIGLFPLWGYYEYWCYGTIPWEGNATHFSLLAWWILWTEEPGGLQAMGSQRAGHDWSNWAHTHALKINK